MRASRTAITLTLLLLGACGTALDDPGEPSVQRKESALNAGLLTPPLPYFQRQGWVYGVTYDGALYCYRHEDALTGTTAWSFGKPVGSGWNVRQVFMSMGAIYVIFENGELWWYKNTGYKDCSATWLGGKRIGYGWNGFNRVAAVGNGVIYAFEPDGGVLWYRHTGYADGSFAWAAGSGKPVCILDYTQYMDMFSFDDGGLFFHSGGESEIYWFRQDNYLIGGTGDGTQTRGSCLGDGFAAGTITDPQFAAYHTIFSGSYGAIYGVKWNGELIWNRLIDPDQGLPPLDGLHHIISNQPARWQGPRLVSYGWYFVNSFARVD